jgi:hypothetical protein
MGKYVIEGTPTGMPKTRKICKVEGCAQLVVVHNHCRDHNRESQRVLTRLRKMHAKPKDGRCAICRIVPETTLHCDHDHKTHEFRGYLCARCNQMLGLAGDNNMTLRRADAYLQTTGKGMTCDDMEAAYILMSLSTLPPLYCGQISIADQR